MDTTTDNADVVDMELVKMLITTILSVILLGRQAFPENCFRKLSPLEFQSQQITHKRLLKSGRPLSYKDDPLRTPSSEGETLVYLRECNNPRLHSLLANLDQIFGALADRLVGKIYICFNDTKEWSEESMLECYTLQFSYTEAEDLRAHAHWAGKENLLLKEPLSGDPFDALKQVVLSCRQLPDPFYTRFFVSAIDSKTELQGVWGGNGHGVREAVKHLKDRKGSRSCRIGVFTCESSSPETPQESPKENSDADDRLLAGTHSGAETPDLPELLSSPTAASGSSELNLAASPARPSNFNDTRSQKLSTTNPYRQSLVDTSSQSQTRLDRERGHVDVLSRDGYSQHAGEQGHGPAVHGNSKKRPAPHDQFVPVTQTSKGRATAAAKHPRLAMIEEVPEDLPPTQRLQTPSQSRQAQRSTFVNPDCESSDFEESASPLAKHESPTATWDKWKSPQGTWQTRSQSHMPQKANTSRLYGNRTEPGGKRAYTRA